MERCSSEENGGEGGNNELLKEGVSPFSMLGWQEAWRPAVWWGWVLTAFSVLDCLARKRASRTFGVACGG